MTISSVVECDVHHDTPDLLTNDDILDLMPRVDGARVHSKMEQSAFAKARVIVRDYLLKHHANDSISVSIGFDWTDESKPTGISVYVLPSQLVKFQQLLDEPKRLELLSELNVHVPIYVQVWPHEVVEEIRILSEPWWKRFF